MKVSFIKGPYHFRKQYFTYIWNIYEICEIDWIVEICKEDDFKQHEADINSYHCELLTFLWLGV